MALEYRIGGGFELMEEGIYPATIVKWEEASVFSQFSGKDEQRLKLTFEFEEEKSDGSPQTRSQLFTPSFHEKAKLYEVCRATGAPVPANEEELRKWSPECLLNRTCMVSIKHTQKNDRTYDNIVGFNKKPKAKGSSRMTEEEVVDPFDKD